VILLSFVTALNELPTLTYVLDRGGGQDWLGTESFARTILESGSLRGGESVFFAQGGMRYVSFLSHAVFGDSDALIWTVALAALSFVAASVALAVSERIRSSLKALSVVWLGAVLLLLLFNAHDVVALVRAGASEYPTWLLLTVAVPLLFIARSRRLWLAAAALLGLCTVMRANQFPAMVFLLGILVARTWRTDSRLTVACVGTFFAIALLPLAHNLYYGHRFVLATTSEGPNQVVPWWEFFKIPFDPQLSTKFWHQLQGVLYVGPMARSSRLGLVLHGLQLFWLAGIVGTALRWHSRSATARVLMLLPAMLLIPHLFYDVSTYYPRHIVAGYVAMAVVVITYMIPSQNMSSDSGPEATGARTGPGRAGLERTLGVGVR
jgi:hypothetical protein